MTEYGIRERIGAPLRTARRRLLHEAVAEYLLDDIRAGVYPVGSRLPSERQLMESFAVGRPAVREALAKLGRLGVIELKPGVRPRVRKPDVAPLLNEMHGAVKLVLAEPEGQRHLQQVRLLFECATARHAAKHIGAGDLQRLRAVLDEQAGVLVDITAWAKLDVAFHSIIAGVPGNPVLKMVQQSLSSWLLEQSLISLGMAASQPSVALAAHEEIYRSLAARDPRQAEDAMERHLEQVYAGLSGGGA